MGRKVQKNFVDVPSREILGAFLLLIAINVISNYTVILSRSIKVGL